MNHKADVCPFDYENVANTKFAQTADMVAIYNLAPVLQDTLL